MPLTGHAQARDQWIPGVATANTNRSSDTPLGSGALSIHPDRSAFATATAGIDLSTEDFREGFGQPGRVSICFQATSDRTDDPCFAPGDLVPGFAIRSSRGSIFNMNLEDSDIVLLGTDVLGTPDPVIGANIADEPLNSTHVSFDPPVIAVGMDVYDGRTGQSVTLTAFDVDDQAIGEFSVQPVSTNVGAFAGFTSTIPVARLALNAPANGAELIAQLAFGGTAGRLVSDEARVEFDAVPVAFQALRLVTLRNVGDLSLTVPSLPSLPPPFDWQANPCVGQLLAPDATCNATIRFAPPHAGSFETSASLGSDDNIAILGEGQSPTVATVPGHLDFGQVAAGGTSAPQSLDLKNLSAIPVEVDTLSTTAGAFSLTGGTCGALPFMLPPGTACRVDLVFAPMVDGHFENDLVVGVAGGQSTHAALSGQTEGAP